MAESPLLGSKVKALRRRENLTQVQLAERLGVSPSYLNHLERNQRPLTAPVLLRMAQSYDLDIRAFVEKFRAQEGLGIRQPARRQAGGHAEKSIH